jgi:hypothetical protein
MNTAGHQELIDRRAFLQQFSALTTAAIPHFPMDSKVNSKRMKEKFDVIIVGGVTMVPGVYACGDNVT